MYENRYFSQRIVVLTVKIMANVRMTVTTVIPAKPTSNNVFRPAFSTSTKETTVIKTLMLPIAKVAYPAELSLKPALWNIVVEKNITALIPLSCWATIIVNEIMSGILRALFVINSRIVTFGTSLAASHSDRICSISSCTLPVPRSQDNARWASSSLPFDRNRYFGDSGQNGNVTICLKKGFCKQAIQNTGFFISFVKMK